jgi:hypothetical protein
VQRVGLRGFPAQRLQRSLELPVFLPLRVDAVGDERPDARGSEERREQD